MEHEIDDYRYRMLDHEEAHEERYHEMRERFRMETAGLRAQNEYLISLYGRLATPITFSVHDPVLLTE